MWKSFKEFMRAVGEWWWAVVIDWLIGIGLGTAQTFGHAQNLPWWVPYVVVLAGFVLACLIAFHKLRIERDFALSQARDKRPILVPCLLGIGTAKMSSDQHPEPLSGIFVRMTISNRGLPSIAHYFSLSIRTESGDIVGEPWWTVDDKGMKVFVGDTTGTPSNVFHRNQNLPTVAMT